MLRPILIGRDGIKKNQGFRRYRFSWRTQAGAVFNLVVFFWRLTVFHFLAVSSFAVPGTGKFAGIFFGGLKYCGFFPAVPGTAKFGGTFPGTAEFDGTFMAVMKFGGTSGGSSEVCRC